MKDTRSLTDLDITRMLRRRSAGSIPEDLIVAVLDHLAQERATPRSRRRPPASWPILVAAGVAILGVTTALFVAGGTVPRPRPAPPSQPRDLTSSGSKIAGPYFVDLPIGRVTLNVPNAWLNDGVGENDFMVKPGDVSAGDDLQAAFDMKRPAPLPGCNRPTLGGSDARSIVDDIRTDPDIVVAPGSDHAIEVGLLKGYVTDVSLGPVTSKSCRDQNVPIHVLTPIGVGEIEIWLTLRQRIRLVILDAPEGHNVLLAVNSAGGQSFDRLTSEATDVIQSLVVQPAPTGSAQESPSANSS